MEIHHKIKPLHGWREFVGEVGIIVFGVLIALGAEQVVEAIHWRHRVEASWDALGLEIGDSTGQSIERQRVAPCIEKRLDFLAEVLDKAVGTGRLQPLGPIGEPLWRTWNHGTWDSIVNAEVSSHIGRDQLTGLGGIYQFVFTLNEESARDLKLWTTLDMMVGPGRALDPGEAAKLRETIAQARLAHRTITIAAIRLRQVVENYGLPYDMPTVRIYVRQLNTYAVCRPIGAVPMRYGTAPFENVVEITRKKPLTNPNVGRPGR